MKKLVNLSKTIALLFAVVVGFSCNSKSQIAEEQSSPRIINIINFIRQCEPRYEDITEDVLYETVVQQVKQLSEYQLPGTFLLQYDALINPRYPELLKNNDMPECEVGAWWEITQPHAEAAGLKWRGRFPWDWHADVGFATGYTPEEREKLVDVYMEKFKSIFGKYPASVGSWFIDAHTLGYMYDKYKITASCNCKDQIGTDGYTLWGGYWNQAYYPSRKNAYMPAQNECAQIPVPIFRMLGSDPIHQYDNGLGGMSQGVISLEPVYREGGADRKWVEWFFQSLMEPALNFNYAQAGQENSFTWSEMREGLEIQIPLIDSLRKQGKIKVETLEASAKWFKEKFPVTPPTSFSALTDVRNEGHKTVWFNSRYYRANLLWKDSHFRFRDIHLFDEAFESDYLTKAGTSDQCIYTTLPFVDGFMWSTRDELAGLRIMDKDGNDLKFDTPAITALEANVLQVELPTTDEQTFTMIFHEDKFEITSTKDTQWALELKAASGKELPFTEIEGNVIKASYRNFDYSIVFTEGSLEKVPRSVFRILPNGNKITIDCSKR